MHNAESFQTYTLGKMHWAEIINTRRWLHFHLARAQGWKHSSIIQPSKCITVPAPRVGDQKIKKLYLVTVFVLKFKTSVAGWKSPKRLPATNKELMGTSGTNVTRLQCQTLPRRISQWFLCSTPKIKLPQDAKHKGEETKAIATNIKLICKHQSITRPFP